MSGIDKEFAKTLEKERHDLNDIFNNLLEHIEEESIRHYLAHGRFSPSDSIASIYIKVVIDREIGHKDKPHIHCEWRGEDQ